MNTKRCVSIVLVIAMMLTMVFTNVVFAEDVSAPAVTDGTTTEPAATDEDGDKPFIGQPAQKSGGFEAPAQAEGKSIIVDPAKGQTITSALDSALDGDTILVKDGTVLETTKVNVWKSVTIKAENPGKAIINVGFTISASNVIIEGLTIGNLNKGEFDAAISFTNGISDCSIIGNTILVSNECYGIITSGKQDNHIIAGNTFNTVGAEAIAKALIFIGIQSDGEEPREPVSEVQETLNIAKNITINGNNVFDGNAEYGVVMEGLGCTVAGNTFKLDATKARLCNTVSNITISGNTFSEITGFTRGGAQFSDVSKKLDLEAVRRANTFEQAAYYIKGHKIYYYIQDAIDNSNSNVNPELAGSEVVVGAGFYRENVKITSSYHGNLKITSIDGNPIDNTTFATICPGNGGYALEIDGSSLSTLQIMNFEIQGMKAVNLNGGSFIKNKFNGLKIDEVKGGEGFAFAAEVYAANGASTSLTTFESNLFTRANDAGLFVTDSNHIKLLKNEFSNNGYILHKCCGAVDKLLEGDGARITDSSDLIVEVNNKFINNYGDGLELDNITALSPDHTLVRYNTFDENWRNGLYVRNSKLVDIITNKSIKNNDMNGILFENCTDVLVSKHSPKVSSDYQGILDNGLAGIQFTETAVVTPTETVKVKYVGDITITKNLISNNGNPLIPVGGGVLGIVGDDVIVSENDILNNKGDGVEIIEGNDNDITKNVITGNLGDGVEIINGTDEDLVTLNTITSNSGVGVDIQESDGKADINTNDIKNNLGGGISLADGFEGDLIKYNNIIENGNVSNADAGGILIYDNSPFINDGTLYKKTHFLGNWNVEAVFTHVKIHYNNIENNVNFGLKRDTSDRAAAAINFPSYPQYKYDSVADMGFYAWNYWGDVSGPSDNLQRAFADWNALTRPASIDDGTNGNLLGTGNGVIFPNTVNYQKNSVKMYTPWISQEFVREIPSDGIPGVEVPSAGASPVIPYAVGKGWNLTSTPVKLNAEYNSWSVIKNIGNGLTDSRILGYDPASKTWKQPGDGMKFDTLDGYYIKMDTVDFIPLVIRTGAQSTPVTRVLKEGWNLVGPALEKQDSWSITETLAGVATTQFNPGWSYVYRPAYQYKYNSIQPTFTYASTSSRNDDPGMLNYAGYWVYMQKDRELAGQTSVYFWDGKDNQQFRSLTDTILNYRNVQDALEN